MPLKRKQVARTVAVLPEVRRRDLRLLAWLPSVPSLVVTAAIAVIAVGAYVAARETSLFAIERIEVSGAPPDVAAKVEAALAPLRGTSLVAFGPGSAARRLAAVPDIAAARYDRDFPHTLRVAVEVERPAAVIRRGRDAWLVSMAGRIIREIAAPPYPALPRVWVARDLDLTVGATVDGDVGTAVATLGMVRRTSFPFEVRAVRAGQDGLRLLLAMGTEVVLGDRSSLRLKLAVARRVLALDDGAAYVDVSVPERAVTGED